jgi:aryl-alcohol dehydrogenase-like predicted oxidoreductase
MEYRTLGRTGMSVSSLCLGAMMFGNWGTTDHDKSIEVIHAALDAGINFIDTADVYSAGESEIITGEALAGSRRDDVILTTKCYYSILQGPHERNPTANRAGASRRHIIRSCEDSLRRLGTDWIDLYLIHRPDPATDIDETLGALSDLTHQGKIRACGTSTFPAEEIVEAHWTSERRGHVRFACEQPPYSIFTRSIERDVLPVIQRYGMGCMVWSPMAGGWLSGRYRRDSGVDMTRGRPSRTPARFDPSYPGNARKLDVIETLVPLAAEAGISKPHLALAFTLEHPAVTSAIIGPRTVAQLSGLLGADAVRLDHEVLDRIDELVRPGTNLNTADSGWEPLSLCQPALRRRHH